MSHRRPSRRVDRHDEPELPDEGRVTWGDTDYWAVDSTTGGAPIGLTRAELPASLAVQDREAPWARAKRVLQRALSRDAPGAAIEVGRVTRLGQGLSRDVFAADADVWPDPSGLSGPYAVLLPARDAGPELDERTEREASLLHHLGQLDLPFRVPRLSGAWRDGARLALVRSLVSGIPLDLRAGRQHAVRPWDVVGQLAAAVHALDATALGDTVTGEPTRRAHVEAWLRRLADFDAPEAQDAFAWVRSHLPGDEPAVLLHGDLLGQNILLDPGQPPGLIDWEYARLGDPAHDLAIVTRGVRRPFQIDRGLERLLEAYRRHGGQPVAPADVHVHELCMLVAWCRDSGAGPDQQARTQLRSLLRRLGA